MSIYDPLGLLSSFLVSLKNLLQDVWKQGTDWDEEITQEHYERWLNWIKKIDSLKEVNIDRCYSPKLCAENKNLYIELHVF